MGINWKSWNAAYHEAGHAVIRSLYGYDIGAVWIGTGGSSSCGGGRGQEAWRRLDEELCVLLGGYAGEVRAWWHTGVTNLQGVFQTCEAPDMARARWIADRMATTEFMVYWAPAAMDGPAGSLTAPMAILEHHWRAVCDALWEYHEVHRDFAMALHKRRRFLPGASAVLLDALITQYAAGGGLITTSPGRCVPWNAKAPAQGT